MSRHVSYRPCSTSLRSRRLAIQQLEARQLLAADLKSELLNIESPVDSNLSANIASTQTTNPSTFLQQLKSASNNKLGGLLTSVLEDYQQEIANESVSTPMSRIFGATKDKVRFHDGKVIIDAVASGDAEQLAKDLTELEADVTGIFDNNVSAWVPLKSLAAVGQLDSLLQARASLAQTNAGIVTSEADIVHRADISREDFEVTGKGLKIGIMSDTFDNDSNPFAGKADDVLSGDLTPFNVVIDEGDAVGGDEGRAMAQLIHDVAPDAWLFYHTAFDGVASFAQGIQDLANSGAQIIVDDVSYFAEPMYSDGPIAQSVDRAVARGVNYFSSAANNGRNSWETVDGFQSEPDPELGIPLHDFDPSDEIDLFQQIEVPIGSQVLFVLQWDDPFASARTPGGRGDVDVYLTNGGDSPSLFNLVAGSFDFNVGLDPVEIFAFFNNGGFDMDGRPGPDTEFSLFFNLFEGRAPERLKYVYYEFGEETEILEYATDSGTIYGHANAAGANSVGAAFYEQTPAYGVDPAELQSYSSAGGTNILFANNGTPLRRPVVRTSPEFVAADGTNNTFFGQDVEGDDFPNFFGTSAAAPHAAAIAALLIEAAGGPGSLSPTQVTSILSSTAHDMMTPGYDLDSGFGLIDAYDALSQVTTPIREDFGDAPSSYGISLADDGPRHVVEGPTLGATRDKERDGAASADALGDDKVRSDDEDGVRISSAPVIGSSFQISVSAPSGGFLNAWIDFNRNGTFDDDEWVLVDEELRNGSNTLTIAVPESASLGSSFMRFRISANDGEVTSPIGFAPNGEVEDYPIVFRRSLPNYLANTEVVNGSYANTNRSGLGTLQLKFDQPMIVADPLSLLVVNRTTNQVISLVDNRGRPLVSLNGNGTSAITWVFSPLLASRFTNGRYTFELRAQDALSLDGSPFSSTAAGTFHIVRGDLNADTRVDVADVNIARSYASATSGSRFRMGDANGDGRVDGSDIAFVSARLNNNTLAPLGLDFGDALEIGKEYPTRLARNGARAAVVSGPRLGATIDAETDGAPDRFAAGDGADEDGATFTIAGVNSAIAASIMVNSTRPVYVSGWIDLNGDGDWLDAGERFLSDRLSTNGRFDVNIPITPQPGTILAFARLRVTSLPGYDFFGFSADGEVEDYLIEIESGVGGGSLAFSGNQRESWNFQLMQNRESSDRLISKPNNANVASAASKQLLLAPEIRSVDTVAVSTNRSKSKIDNLRMTDRVFQELGTKPE